MNQLPVDFNKLPNKTQIQFVCEKCGNTYLRLVRDTRTAIRNKKFRCVCKPCSIQKTGTTKNCKVCNKAFYVAKCKQAAQFCSKSCSATYNNTHKSHGTRRSKLEKWIEFQLTAQYPNVEFVFNKKDAINSELDIYIPSLKLAFELNGIFHYEPIFSKEQLQKSQNNDKRKMQACLEENIELCVIDISAQKYFKPETSCKYLQIIQNIIEYKLLTHIA